MRPGPANSLLDVAGLRVGHHHRTGGGYRTGTTVVLAPPGGMVAGVDVRGAAPGTRETELLDPRNLVDRVHAIVLTGGSAYGLSAACGVVSRLADAGIGFPVEGGVVPIVPAAVIYDLGRGGAFRATPDATFGQAAYDAAVGLPDRGSVPASVGCVPDRTSAPANARSGLDRTTVATPGVTPATSGALSPNSPSAGDGGAGVSGTSTSALNGSVGAGAGAVAGGLAGGVGNASAVLPGGGTVAALVVVNAAGSVLDPGSGRPAGARYGLPGEFDRLREPREEEVAAWQPEGLTSLNTTIGVVATDLTLTKAQCAKLAAVAHDGLARAIRPAHTMVDGDTIFAVATCALPEPDAGEQDGQPGAELHDLLAAGADVFSRAVAHAVLAATGWEDAPAYLDVFPSAIRP